VLTAKPFLAKLRLILGAEENSTIFCMMAALLEEGRTGTERQSIKKLRISCVK